ncbi:hypothetical protein PV328_012441 [Microctonus aethiopoides]|uniref:Uncharacterized protein n=1 Tax=Microctonus aethiopoides TaxID=144406 RepID=A0AA39C252_9HYME|nr:hypothetical protein PV328_012441 [Microctonus aethiopoides]
MVMSEAGAPVNLREILERLTRTVERQVAVVDRLLQLQQPQQQQRQQQQQQPPRQQQQQPRRQQQQQQQQQPRGLRRRGVGGGGASRARWYRRRAPYQPPKDRQVLFLHFSQIIDQMLERPLKLAHDVLIYHPALPYYMTTIA